MTEYALRVDSLGKRYRLGLTAVNSHPRLRDAIASGVKRVTRNRWDRGSTSANREFWALRDVSFAVRAGEVLGIVGSNGAGKSTLLKILARVVEPTTGTVAVRGRIGALLEVGTGFHPELTGRENIYLNASILGMSRADTTRKLDEIIAFSGIEPFIDTPVKRYSNGMYLRLAFSVAAHIDPEILIIDEVLAVGDAAFQRKCIGKVGQIAESGRTVLFVSHQLSVVQKLCTRAIFVGDGTVQAEGTTHDVIEMYLRAVEARSLEDMASRAVRGGRGRARIAGIDLISAVGVPTSGQPLLLRFRVEGDDPVECSFTIYDEFGDAVTSFDSADHSDHDLSGEEFSCLCAPLLLRPGRYRINSALTSADGEMEDHLEGAVMFDVHPGVLDGRLVAAHPGYGSVTLPHRWTKKRP
jgi:lipopolysaccharide transport system ATP-binding protein